MSETEESPNSAAKGTQKSSTAENITSGIHYYKVSHKSKFLARRMRDLCQTLHYSEDISSFESQYSSYENVSKDSTCKNERIPFPFSCSLRGIVKKRQVPTKKNFINVTSKNPDITCLNSSRSVFSSRLIHS